VKIKPCPFCGFEPEGTDGEFVETQGSKWGALGCNDCGMVGPEVRTNYDPIAKWKDRAIEAWNERVAA